MWLDPEHRDCLVGLLDHAEHEAYQLLHVDFLEDGQFAYTYMLRLWRHGKHVRYKGRVHERLEPYGFFTNFKDSPRACIRLNHDGYTRELERWRVERNNRLIEEQLAEDPDDPYYKLYRILGMSNDELMDSLNETLAEVNTLASLYDLPPTYKFADVFVLLLEASADSGRSHLVPKLLVDRAVTWFQRNPRVAWSLVYHNQHNGKAAVATALEEQLTNHKLPVLDFYVWFDPAVLGSRLYQALNHYTKRSVF
jgi:hypothetical protein